MKTLKQQSTYRKWYAVRPFNSSSCDDLGCMSRSFINCKLFYADKHVAKSLCHSIASWITWHDFHSIFVPYDKSLLIFMEFFHTCTDRHGETHNMYRYVLLCINGAAIWVNLVALARWWRWLSGRTSAFSRRTFRVARPTPANSRGYKPSAAGQPTRPTQPFILSGSINE